MAGIPTFSASWFRHSRDGGLSLLYGRPEVNSLAQKLLVRPLSRGYGVTILDGGNLFDPYLISRMAQTLGRTPREFLSKILVSRSFTCHQTHALVHKVASLNGDKSRIVLVLGCLTTFYDEEISLGERTALLKKTLMLLKEISQRGSRIFVTSTDPPVDVRGRFTDLLIHAADRAARLELDPDGTLRIAIVKLDGTALLKR
ncbi:MAG: hypothetical protein ACREQA_12240 [Candidatus Binatia bacterium]